MVLLTAGSSIVRTFALTRGAKMATDQPIDFDSYLYDDGSPPLGGEDHSTHRAQNAPGNASQPSEDAQNKSTSHRRHEDGVSDEISEEARRFLSGPLSTVFIPSLYTLVCVVSLPLNAVALVAFARRPRPVKPAAIFMLNLAAADLLFALLLPLRIHYHFRGNHWVFGETLCRLATASFYCNMYCSVLLIACIAADRLLAVVYPVRSLVWRRPRYAAWACLTAWALALAASAPLVAFRQTVRLEGPGVTTCHDVQEPARLRGLYAAYFTAVVCGLFLLPALVTLVCYARVAHTLRRLPDRTEHDSRRKRRATLMALTVLALFLVCFAPTNCLLLLHYLRWGSAGEGSAGEAPDGSYAAYLVCLCVGSLNCCLDPLIYYFGSSQCQQQLSAALGCGKGPESGRKKGAYWSSEVSSRTSSRIFFKSSQNRLSGVKAKPDSVDSLQPGLNSQYKKLLV
ncbi:hypothetical protein NHX12_027309 [Muraenolepis orangiensis]|uniref:Proteinase-activated receptor 1 n=1 Tax=Muraenolepis orangiensis TaxID=630683 RepID=A0A9Q0INQ5_9TELE|nr:hypothetical protein NHX12_027309 [Muraenolepis orangiensis]